jgi:hypothetical protein
MRSRNPRTKEALDFWPNCAFGPPLGMTVPGFGIEWLDGLDFNIQTQLHQDAGH